MSSFSFSCFVPPPCLLYIYQANDLFNLEVQPITEKE